MLVNVSLSENESIPQLFYFMGLSVSLAVGAVTGIALAEADCLPLMGWVIS